jgi:RNA polymerase sigma-70 factor (ECF subfamily)
MANDIDMREVGRLAARSAHGDRDAFRTLVEKTHPTVYRLALRIVGSETDAEDVVQETFVRAWQSLATVRDPRAAFGWICRVARNVAYDRVRGSGRRPETSLDQPVREGLSALVDLLSTDDPNPEDVTASQEAGEAIRAAVEGLKEKHRLVLLLRAVDGMSYEEIAEALGCAVGTVESRLFRARKALAKKLKKMAKDLGGTPGWEGGS